MIVLCIHIPDVREEDYDGNLVWQVIQVFTIFLDLKGQCDVLKPCNILWNMKSRYSVFLSVYACILPAVAFSVVCLPKHMQHVNSTLPL